MSITVRFPTGLPDPSGRPEWSCVELPFVDGQNLSAYLGMAPAEIMHVIYDGAVLRPEMKFRPARETAARKWTRKIFTPWSSTPGIAASDIDLCTPRDGDTVILIPKMGGKNASIILGVVGAIVGFYLGGPGGASAGWTWGAALQGAAIGYSLGSTVGALMTPKPKTTKPGDDANSSQVWGGITNEDRAGVPVPVIFGRHRVGGVRISTFVRRTTGGATGARERLYMLILLGKGPIESVTDVRLNGQPIVNFPGATYDVRYGTDPQLPIAGFNAVANTTSVQADLASGAYTYTTASSVDAFEVLVTVPGLFHTTSEGTQKLNTTRYKVEYRVYLSGGPWVDAGTKSVSASSRANQFSETRVEGLALARYDVQVTYVSADFVNDQRDAWKPFVTGITEEVGDTRTYDGSALLAVKGIATEQINSMPTVDCVVEGMKLPTWNGTAFTARAYSRNRAWAALEMFRNTSVGLGNYVTDAELDLNSFKDWAADCAAIANVTPSVGSPYTEARHELSIVLNQQRNAVELITDLFSGGRAMWVLSGRKFRAVSDKWRAPVQMFTVANLGGFSISYRSEKDRFNTFDVTILDESRDWETSPFEVFDTTEVTTNGKPKRRQPLQLVGTTRRSEGTREAEFRLRSQLLTRRVISFTVWLDALLAEVGDCIAISHDLPQWGYSGIVAGGGASSITLDRAVTIEPAKVYDVQVRWSDGTNDAGEVRRVSNTPGTYTNLTVTVPFTKTPARPDMYAFGETAIVVKPFVILSISRDGDSYRKVTAIEHLEAVYDVTGTVTVPTYSQLPNLGAPPAAITHLAATEEVGQRNDESWISTLILGWTRPGPAPQRGIYDRAMVERSWNGTNWEFLGYGTDEFRWENAPHSAQMWFRVTPISTQGKANLTGPASVDTGAVGAGATTISIPLGKTAVLTGGQVYVITIGGETRIVANALPGSYAAVTVTEPFSVAPVATTPWQIRYFAGYAEQSVTTTGKTTAPDAVSNFVATSKDNSFVFTWGESIKAEWVELRTADANWGDTVPANGFVWRGKGQVYAEAGPSSRVRQLYAKRVDAFGNYSVGAVTNGATAIDAAPAAPTIGTIVRLKNALKIPVTPPAATPDIVAFHLHASQSASFTPSNATRVASVVGGVGGEFLFAPSASGTWYFRATCEDWLSETAADWVYTGEFSSSLLIVVAAAPTSVILNLPVDTGLGLQDAGGTVTTVRRRVITMNWSHIGDGTNPANSLIGYQCVIYDTVADPTIAAPLADSGVLATPAMTWHKFPIMEFLTSTTIAGAVKAIYVDGVTSAWVTSLGTTVGPDGATLGDVISADVLGRIEIPEACVDFFPLAVDAIGVLGTAPLVDRAVAPVAKTLYYPGIRGLELFPSPGSANEIDEFALTAAAWTKTNCAVSTPENERLPLRPPDSSVTADGLKALRVFKVTVTAGATPTNLYAGSSIGGGIAGTGLAQGFWVKNLSATAREAQVYLWANIPGGATGGHQTFTLPPGVWVRAYTTPGLVWNLVDAGSTITPVLKFAKSIATPTECDAGDVFAVCLPQIVAGGAGTWLPPFALEYSTVAPGAIHLPPMGLAQSAWTAFLRYRLFSGYLATASGATVAALLSACGINGSAMVSLWGLREIQLNTGATRKLEAFYYDAAPTPAEVVSSIAHGYADDAERIVALRRNGNVLSIFGADAKLLEWDTTVDIAAEALYPCDRVVLGAKTTTGAPSVGGTARNLAVISAALTDADVLKVLRLGVNFVENPGRVIVPAPTLVTISEV